MTIRLRLWKLVEKKAFPSAYAKASTVIVPLLVSGFGISYFFQTILKPAAEVYPLAITAVGATATLTALCFSFPGSRRGADTIWFGGEQLLHSTILLIQSMVVIFVRDNTIAAWKLSGSGVGNNVTALANFLLLAVSTYAFLKWDWGIEAVNNQLWQNYRERIEANPAKSKEQYFPYPEEKLQPGPMESTSKQPLLSSDPALKANETKH